MNFSQELESILAKSEYLNTIRAYNQEPSPVQIQRNPVRSLTSTEIALLESQRNRCANWNNIIVSQQFSTQFIFDNFFCGICKLGAFSGAACEFLPSLQHPSGIYKSTIINADIGNDSLIHASTISNYATQENTIVYNIGTLSCSDDCTFGNGIPLLIGLETGGRDIQSFADMTISLASFISLHKDNKSVMQEYADFIRAYIKICTSSLGIVCHNSKLINTPTIVNCFLGQGSIIDGATLVKNSTVYCSTSEPASISHGAIVKDSCVQWGCKVSSMAIVDTSILIEHSHVERHGKVIHSIIGANTGIAEGEVTSSLVGPFVGFHHQALLIAAMWPEGKGNVGYGANIGSNHTAKAPDQEIICGEGMFFGLGTNVKFPSNFSQAPYSILSTAITTLPQKVEFPFSLINTPFEQKSEIPPAYNEIIPAWVLSDNIYAIRRNQAKFINRNKATRSTIDYEVFRPEIIDMIVKARIVLRNVKMIKEIYLEKDVPGLGKNYLTEANRCKAIATYNFYIEYYALCGFCFRLAELLPEETDLIAIFTCETEIPMWEHTRILLIDEGYAHRGIKDNLIRCKEMNSIIAKNTQKAKEKDDKRGMAIIKDYKVTHILAQDDSFVKKTWEDMTAFNSKIDDLLMKIC